MPWPVAIMRVHNTDQCSCPQAYTICTLLQASDKQSGLTHTGPSFVHFTIHLCSCGLGNSWKSPISAAKHKAVSTSLYTAFNRARSGSLHWTLHWQPDTCRYSMKNEPFLYAGMLIILMVENGWNSSQISRGKYETVHQEEKGETRCQFCFFAPLNRMEFHLEEQGP